MSLNPSLEKMQWIHIIICLLSCNYVQINNVLHIQVFKKYSKKEDQTQAISNKLPIFLQKHGQILGEVAIPFSKKTVLCSLC